MKLAAFKTLNRKVTLATVGLLTLVTLGNVGTALADSTTTPNTTDARKITIHAVNGIQKQSNDLGPNDGSALDITGKQVLANVGFSAVKIVPTSGSAVTMKANDSSTYTTSGTAISGATDPSGTVVLNVGSDNTNDGYYLVTQTTSSDGITATAPFIVQVPLNASGTTPDGSWTYNVNVYPKLDANQYSTPDKTIDLNDNTQTDKQSSNFAGQNVTWNLATNFPNSMRIKNSDGSFSYGTAEFKDQLNANLTYKSINFSTALQNTTTNAFSNINSLTLTETTDYTVTTTAGAVDLKLTNAGIDKILAALPTSTSDSVAMFIPNITTQVSAAYKYGQIGNSFIPNLTNAYGINLNPNNTPSNDNTPTNPGGGNVPDLYLGALTIKKIDSVSKTALEGATFAIATSQDNASKGKYIQKDANGILYADISAVPNGVKTTDYTQTTDGTGQAQFSGLKLVDNTAVNSVDKANTTYYVTEISAPKGYNVANAPFEVTAGISPINNNLTNNLNGSNIHLPFTGGQGMIGLIIIAGVAAGASIVIRRRRTKDEA